MTEKNMKNFKKFLLVAVAVLFVGASAQAGGFKFGVKAGVNFNELHFNKETILNDLKNKDNHAGYTAGLMAEFTAPVLGIGFDAGLNYVHRPTLESLDGENKLKRDFIEIPVNLKYKLEIPAIEKVIAPYIYTGPSFAFKLGKSEIKDFIKTQKCDIAWNIGLGLELFNHVQVGGGYGFGITKLVNTVSQKAGEGQVVNPVNLEGRNNCWNVSVAYLF